MLKVRVRAAPEDGKANDAVVKLLAAHFGMRRSDIEVVAGAAARIKQIALRGDVSVLQSMLARLADGRGKIEEQE